MVYFLNLLKLISMQTMCFAHKTFYYSVRRSVAVTHEVCCDVHLCANDYLWYVQIFKTAVGWQ